MVKSSTRKRSDKISIQTDMFKVFEEMGLRITSSFDINEIMMIFLPAAVSITHADTGGLILIDEASLRVLDAYEYIKGKNVAERYKSTARLTEGLTGEILKTRKPVVISNLHKYKNVNPTSIEKKRASVAGFPLIARKKMLGILFVDFFLPREFTKTEIDYLRILCSQAGVALDNTLLYKKVCQEAKEMALLYEVSQSIISTLDSNRLLKNILKRLKNTFGYLNLAILLVDGVKQELYPRAYINCPEQFKKLRYKIGKEGITGHVAATKKMYYSPDVRKDPYHRIGDRAMRSESCFPLLIGKRLIGVLDVGSPEIAGFTQDDINLLSSLSAQIAIALENSRLYEEAKKLSLTDPLTMLANRRKFDMFIDTEIKRAGRYHRSFSILMIDLDNFKNYNDKFGHVAGDDVLKIFGGLMKEIVRDVDFMGRYGGDEFIAVLPETEINFALEVAERMKEKIAPLKSKSNITLSIGLASFPKDAKDKKSLIALADRACYEAKQMGGNCVHLASKLKPSGKTTGKGF